jgi:hypothetical protein
MERAAKSPAWEDALAEVERICESRHLCESRGIQALLRFVVEHTAEGDLHALKEYNIGREVFHRRADYDPRLDPIVRVQASALRKRLEAYYAAEGSTSRIRIALPRGGYTAEVRPNEPLPVAAESEPPVPVPLSPPEPPALHPMAEPDARGRARVSWWLVVAGIALTTLAGWSLFRTSSQATTHNAKQVVSSEIWGHFLNPGKKSLLVFGVPQFFNVDGGYVRDPSVNSPGEIGKSKMFQRWGPNPEHHLRPTYIYTGVGEVKGAVELSRWFWTHGADTGLRTSNEFTVQELEENDVILVSSSRFKTWLDREALPADFVFAETSPARSVENRSPRPGEPRLLRSEQVADARTSYAIISLWPGKSPGRWLLSIRGADTQSTQAAVAFMTSEKHLAEIDRKLALDRAESAAKPCLQIVLRIDIQGERAQGAAYATHHRMPLPRSQ